MFNLRGPGREGGLQVSDGQDGFLIVSDRGQCALADTFYRMKKYIVPSQTYRASKIAIYIQLHCVREL